MFTVSSLTLISSLKERICSCRCLPQLSLSSCCNALQKRKNCNFWTHSVLRKVWCGVTGEIFISTLSRLKGERRRRGEDGHNYQRAGFLLAVCVCRPPSFPVVTGCPAGPPATQRHHGDAHTCVSQEGARRSIYNTRAPANVWDGRRGEKRWKCEVAQPGEMCKDMHARTWKAQMASNFGHTNTPRWVIGVLTVKEKR